jgi:hypothetical protein
MFGSAVNALEITLSDINSLAKSVLNPAIKADRAAGSRAKHLQASFYRGSSKT